MQEKEKLAKEKEKQERKLKREKEKVKKGKASKAQTRSARTTRRGASNNKPVNALKEHLQKLSLSDSTSETESEAECPMCGLIYGAGDDDSTWMQCDCCKLRRYLECAGVSDIPEFFSCTNCR